MSRDYRDSPDPAVGSPEKSVIPTIPPPAFHPRLQRPPLANGARARNSLKTVMNYYSLFRGKSRTDLFMVVKRPRMANCSYGRLPQGATSPIWHNWSSAVYRLSLSTKERRFRLAGNNF